MRELRVREVGMVGKIILNDMGIDAMVESSIDLDEAFVIRSITTSSSGRRDMGGPIGFPIGRRNLVNQIFSSIG
jgi:hypothetical protein